MTVLDEVCVSGLWNELYEILGCCQLMTVLDEVCVSGLWNGLYEICLSCGLRSTTCGLMSIAESALRGEGFCGLLDMLDVCVPVSCLACSMRSGSLLIVERVLRGLGCCHFGGILSETQVSVDI